MPKNYSSYLPRCYVTNTRNNGTGSLRACMMRLYNVGPCYVAFNITAAASDGGIDGGVGKGGAESHTIYVTGTALPHILAPYAYVDADTQPLETLAPHRNPRAPRVIVDGSRLPPVSRSNESFDISGLVIMSNNVVVKGLGIHGFPSTGVIVSGKQAVFSGQITGCLGQTGLYTASGADNFTLGVEGAIAPSILAGNYKYGATFYSVRPTVLNTWVGIGADGNPLYGLFELCSCLFLSLCPPPPLPPVHDTLFLVQRSRSQITNTMWGPRI